MSDGKKPKNIVEEFEELYSLIFGEKEESKK